ncbi:Cwf15/Cwc15 cell cycle control protein [Violaceomyces palustris]|uniref:Cwf15/Cwc15 cell cycle control protein n=1 Tax=Violaceomyces palustris TaxID=1673888 RepID=A0ACD0P5H5_9BASI|nr:Cwf15/Cwc15 cell cycle control protein [Violaceomyces palustris]
MSSAHRPTWAPAKGQKDNSHVSKQFGPHSLPSHTKLKFRQPGQGVEDEIRRRDLKRELEEAEREVRRRKGLEDGLMVGEEKKEEDMDGEVGKRRRVMMESRDLDRDDDDEEEEEEEGEEDNSKSGFRGDSNGKGKMKERERSTTADGKDSDDSGSSDSDSDSDDSDEEDDTAALLRELEKIKRERAEEKARLEREREEKEKGEREDEIALGNPLLNLENAIGGRQPDFGVKRRWDDDVIFKNQAAGNDRGDGAKRGFVNDLTRTEFHRKFMNRYIK